MRINGKITFLINPDKTTIEVFDEDSRIVFLSIELTPEQLSSALSRLGHTPCSIESRNLDKVGCTREMKSLVFEIPRELYFTKHENTSKLWSMAQVMLNEEDEGWSAEFYFGSRDSTFYKHEEDKYYARATCVRWINKETGLVVK